MKLHVDRYRSEEDHSYSYDDLDYDDAESVIMIGMFDFCGCGDHDAMMKTLIEVMEWSKTRDFSNKPLPDGPLQIMLNLLDNKGMAEHGSSVFGSWLTTLGEEVLEDLKQILADKA